jgi:oligoendopeptidase F
MQKSVPARSELRANRTWDVQSVFPDDGTWEAAIADVERQIPIVSSFRGRLAEGASVLLEYLDATDEFFRAVGKIYVYAAGVHSVDTTNQGGVAKFGRARGLFGQAVASTAFAEPEVLAIGRERIEGLMEEEPRLRVYGHYIENLFREAVHVRSAEVEEVLGLAQDPFGTATSIHGVLTDTDLKFRPARDSNGREIELVQGNYHDLLNSEDREIRRTAWENYTDGHRGMQNTMAACLSAGIKRDVFNARVRHYGSSLEASLAPNNIPLEVFHNLVDTFRQNLPTWHRYWRVRRQALGVDQLHPYDVWAPLGSRSPQIPYEEAVDLICQGMSPLGDEYVETLRRGCLDERWVDVYPNKGKMSGAFSDGFPGTYPFILMSYTDDVFSLSTLAHELGHSLHSYFTWQNQPLVYSQYSMFVAETASNFNQALVRSHLLASRSDLDFQLALIEEAMSNFHRYFFIMPTLARLELEIHEKIEQGQELTAEGLTERMTELFREGYGDEVHVDEERVGITWGEFSHHMYGNFYVFQYATGISAANSLAQSVVDEGRPAAERYLNLLKAGGSVYPIDGLRAAGVDMTTPEPVNRAFAVLAQTVDRLEEIVGQRSASKDG